MTAMAQGGGCLRHDLGASFISISVCDLSEAVRSQTEPSSHSQHSDGRQMADSSAPGGGGLTKIDFSLDGQGCLLSQPAY